MNSSLDPEAKGHSLIPEHLLAKQSQSLISDVCHRQALVIVTERLYLVKI